MLEAIEKNYTIGKIWAAWGDSIDNQFYLGDGLYDIQEVISSDQWFYRGTMTKAGNPRHPLYLKSDEKFNWFPIADYAADWRFSNLNPKI